jgi:hypothetical protein
MRFSRAYCPRPPCGRGRARKRYGMSDKARQQRRDNIVKARASGAVKVWRSHDESLVIRRLVRQWVVESDRSCRGAPWPASSKCGRATFAGCAQAPLRLSQRGDASAGTIWTKRGVLPIQCGWITPASLLIRIVGSLVCPVRLPQRTRARRLIPQGVYAAPATHATQPVTSSCRTVARLVLAIGVHPYSCFPTEPT